MGLYGWTYAVDPVDGDGLSRFEFEQPQMGVPFRMVVYAVDAATAERGARAAFDRVSALNAILSDYEPESEVSRLRPSAGTGRAVPVSEPLGTVLNAALTMARASDGAFDPTVGPLVQLWRRSRRNGRMPTTQAIAEARTATGWEAVTLMRDNGWRVTMSKPGMRLDFGGIAKGFAADEALKTLRELGLPRALVGASGDFAAGDPPPGKLGWRIAVTPMEQETGVPREGDRVSERDIWLSRAGLTTSGDRYQFVELDGVRYSHIVSPKTGLGLTERVQATVIAPTAMEADALATTLCVKGCAAAVDWFRGYTAARGDAVAALVFGFGADGRYVREPSQSWSRYQVAE
jgi:thiamine biosynthesis lipoprotein